MARSGHEQAAVNRSRALASAEVSSAGGGVTYRVAVAHSDPDHDSSATFHYGPAFNEQLADVIAHVRGCAPGDIDLLAEAQETIARAREEYPEADGWTVGLEAVLPHPHEDDQHVIRRVEVE